MDEKGQGGRTGARILALQGSPRRGGNTDVLLDLVLEAGAALGATVEKVSLRDLKISPCLEIGECLKTGRCPIQDDMTGLYDKLTAAKVLIVASPIFFYGPSAQLKTAIDRGQALWARKYVLKQEPPARRGRGYVVSTAATSGERLFEGLLMTVRYFFDVLYMDLAGQLLVRDLDRAGEVRKRPEALEQARALGEEAARISTVNPEPFPVGV
ncbi:MAG: flavodoxin family protein [Thermodesulfobacteriota bacterium]